MTLRMEIWVEGPTDARTGRREDMGEERPVAEGGALVPLVRKVLGSAGGMTEQALEQALPEREIQAHRLQSRFPKLVALPDDKPRLNLSAKGKKVLTALRRIRRERPDTLIVAVWDRDGEDAPLKDRDVILEFLRRHGERGAAVGICIEEVEAWLLADPGAFRRAFKHGPKSGLTSSPEDEPDPKAKLDEVLASYPDVEDRVVAFRQLAQAIDLETLTRSCPRGFGAFRAALLEFIRPVLHADGG